MFAAQYQNRKNRTVQASSVPVELLTQMGGVVVRLREALAADRPDLCADQVFLDHRGRAVLIGSNR